jgi:hypothetical protein
MAGVLVDLNITISVPVLDKLTLSSSEVRRLATEYLLEVVRPHFSIADRYSVVRKLN